MSSKRLSRRDFAKRSVGATSAEMGAAAARRHRIALPPALFGYGGDPASMVGEFRDSIALAGQAGALQTTTPETINGWRTGTTIPPSFYLNAKQYVHDERFIAEHFWLMADHESRIQKPGDYFVFAYGRGESVIVLRDKNNAIKAFHNVCRHRASRMVRHDRDPAPADAAQLSVKQLGPSGNSPVFRCPYHAWTYDLDGRLISAPNGMPSDFDFSENGLIPCHTRSAGGFIFLNLSLEDPPDFETVVDPSRTPQNWRTVCEEYGTAKLKIAARRYYPVKANWKLVLENFHECYHCGPAHRALVKAHPFWDGTMSPEQRTRLAKELERYIPEETRRRSAQSGMGGSGLGGGILNVGFVSGSLDGKAVAPLLPTKKEWTHRQRVASTAWALGCIQCYDDYVAVVRHTPRDVDMTDVEIIWLVNADAKAGRDYTPERVMALWDTTEREDRWIVENQMGYLSSAYAPGRYATAEGGPSRFIQWYMKEMAVPA